LQRCALAGHDHHGGVGFRGCRCGGFSLRHGRASCKQRELRCGDGDGGLLELILFHSSVSSAFSLLAWFFHDMFTVCFLNFVVAIMKFTNRENVFKEARA
jgi:hypothetical protein